MPLEGFQENMRLGESLSIIGIVLQHLGNGMISWTMHRQNLLPFGQASGTE